MFENFKNIFKRVKKKDLPKSNSKDTAKERLHLVLMQDRVNVSADFLDLMREEMVEVLKKYIEIDESKIDIRLTTEINENGEQSVPALYANIPIIKIKEEIRTTKKNTNNESISIDLFNIGETKVTNNENKDKKIEDPKIEVKTEEKTVEKVEAKDGEKNDNNIEKSKEKTEEKTDSQEIKKEEKQESEAVKEEKINTEKSQKKAQEKNKNEKDVKEENNNEK